MRGRKKRKRNLLAQQEFPTNLISIADAGTLGLHQAQRGIAGRITYTASTGDISRPGCVSGTPGRGTAAYFFDSEYLIPIIDSGKKNLGASIRRQTRQDNSESGCDCRCGAGSRSPIDAKQTPLANGGINSSPAPHFRRKYSGVKSIESHRYIGYIVTGCGNSLRIPVMIANVLRNRAYLLDRFGNAVAIRDNPDCDPNPAQDKRHNAQYNR
jgi:hypothetical protein